MSDLKDLAYLDKDYASRKLTVLLRDICSYNSGEFWRQMSRIASGATGRDHAEELEKKVKELEGQVEDLARRLDGELVQVSYLDELLKHAYCGVVGADSIVGLDCCDDYRDWIKSIKG